MKLILTQPVEKLGKPGDIVNVADGYGRNFLLPRKLAIVADKASMKIAEQIATDHDRRETRLRGDAQKVGERLQAATITIRARAGQETGKLYGSVTASDLVEAIQSQVNIEVERRRVELDEPIRSLGEHSVPIRLHSDVTANVRVQIVPIE